MFLNKSAIYSRIEDLEKMLNDENLLQFKEMASFLVGEIARTQTPIRSMDKFASYSAEMPIHMPDPLLYKVSDLISRSIEQVRSGSKEEGFQLLFQAKDILRA